MTKTVYIVGAGASHDLDDNMPVGNQLATRIQQTLYDEVQRTTTNLGEIGSVLDRNGGFGSDHKLAMLRIANGIGSVDSIDQFVDQCQDVQHLALIAKLAIAHEIGRAEKASLLAKHHARPDPLALNGLRDKWLGLICRYNNRPANRQHFDGIFEGVTFVTYNYDRCIEEFLFQWAYLTLGATESMARNCARSIPVHHIYGSLGDPFDESPTKCDFGDPTPQSLWNTAQSIRTFTEGEHSENIITAREAVQHADKVVFLGTGYHYQNLKILWPDGPISRQKIYGTTFMMRDRAREFPRVWFKGASQRTFKPLNCTQFIFELQDDLFLAEDS